MVNKSDIIKFSEVIETLVKEKDLTYLEAILYHCEKTELEIETVIPLIGPAIKSKLAQNASDLNLITKIKKLPRKKKK